MVASSEVAAAARLAALVGVQDHDCERADQARANVSATCLLAAAGDEDEDKIDVDVDEDSFKADVSRLTMPAKHCATWETREIRASVAVCKWGSFRSPLPHRLCGKPSPSQRNSQFSHRQNSSFSLLATHRTPLSHIRYNMTNGIVNGAGLESQFGELSSHKDLGHSLTTISSPQLLSVSMAQNQHMYLLT